MAYDSARRVVVLFGGNLNTSQGETWEWDGIGWFQHTPVHQPPVRDGHALAYDSARRVMVLLEAYGGDQRGGTWEWDGTDWTQRTSAHRPPSLYAHAMAYDSVRGVVVLFGGYVWDTGEERLLSETWEWDGTDWAQRAPAQEPLARRGHALAYDSNRGVVVLF